MGGWRTSPGGSKKAASRQGRSARRQPEPPEPESNFIFDGDTVRIKMDDDKPPETGRVWPTGVTRPAGIKHPVPPDLQERYSFVSEDPRSDRFLYRHNPTNVLKWVTGRDLDHKGLTQAFADSKSYHS